MAHVQRPRRRDCRRRLPFASLKVAAAAAAAFAAGTLYEYLHTLAHARMPLRWRYLARMRRHHMMHHHVADARNFGIVTDFVDWLAEPVAQGGGRSQAAYNLGYAGDLVRDYPYVEEHDRRLAAISAGRRPRSEDAAPTLLRAGPGGSNRQAPFTPSQKLFTREKKSCPSG